MRILVVAVLLDLIVGCKREPNCEDAVQTAAKHVAAFADPKARSEAIAECSRDRWSDEVRRCLAGIHNESDLAACEPRYLKAMRQLAASKTDLASIAVKKYAFEAFPQWAAAHPDEACPDRLEELNEYMASIDTKDPWGGRYRLLCGSSLPADTKGIGVISPGPDGKEGTSDDVKSW